MSQFILLLPKTSSLTGETTSKVVNWTDASDDETGFDIEWGKDPSYATGAAEVEADVEEYEIESLDEGRLYFVRVRSFNLAGPSDWIEGSFVA